MTDILTLLEELQSIARTGLNYSTDPYARAHYTRLLEIAATQYGQALDLPPDEVRARLQGELGSITPKVGADAAIFDEAGRILLVERSDDRRWGLPAGWVDPYPAAGRRPPHTYHQYASGVRRRQRRPVIWPVMRGTYGRAY